MNFKEIGQKRALGTHQLICQLSFSKWNSIESKESIEFVEDYFLVIFIFKITKNGIQQNLKNL